MTRYITAETYNKLKADLNYLKTEQRKEIAQRIRVAKEFGDLSENAEYSEALEAQRQLEQQIFELENILKEAVIKRPAKNKDKVDIGVQLEVKDLQTKKKHTFILVGFGEAKPLENKISTESPLGKAFWGKKAGDKVEVNINGQIRPYQILKIF